MQLQLLEYLLKSSANRGRRKQRVIRTEQRGDGRGKKIKKI
jgi:hypothetical protein